MSPTTIKKTINGQRVTITMDDNSITIDGFSPHTAFQTSTHNSWGADRSVHIVPTEVESTNEFFARH